MLIVAGTLQIDPDQHEAFVAAAAVVMAATAQEEGCRQYTFSDDLQDRGLIHLFEIWTSEAHLASHLQARHIAEYVQATGHMVRRRSLVKYGIDSEAPL